MRQADNVIAKKDLPEALAMIVNEDILAFHFAKVSFYR